MRKALNRVFIIVLLCFMSSVSFAQTYFYVDGSCANNGDGSAQNCAEVAGGIGAINSLPNLFTVINSVTDRTILIKQGTYTFSSDLNVRARNTFVGVDSNWQELPLGSQAVVWRANSFTPSVAAINIDANNANGTGTKTFRGITFDGRNMPPSSGRPYIGILHTYAGADKDSTIVFENCTFTNNLNTAHGFYFIRVNSPTYQVNVTLRNCYTVDLKNGNHNFHANKLGDFTIDGGTYQAYETAVGCNLFYLTGCDSDETAELVIKNATFTTTVSLSANTHFVSHIAKKFDKVTIQNNTFTLNNSAAISGLVRLGGNDSGNVRYGTVLVENNIFNDYSTASRSGFNWCLTILPDDVAVTSCIVRGNLFRSKAIGGYIMYLGVDSTSPSGYDNTLDGLIFEKNTIYGHSYLGDANPRFTNAVFYGHQKKGHFRYNYLNGCGFGFVIKNLTGQDWNYEGGVYGNVIVNTRAMFGGSIIVLGGKKLNISNNTLYTVNTDSAAHIVCEANFATGEYHTFAKIYNNVLVSTTSTGNGMINVGGTNGENNTHSIDYNCYYTISGVDNVQFASGGVVYPSFTAWKANTTFDAHSFFLNPKFENPAAYRFYLKAGSPCLGKGTKLASPFNTGLAKASSVSDSAIPRIRTILQPVPFTIGAYSMRKVCIPGSLILCSYQ